ncbi:MAG TPA: hypothetical protein VKB02_12540 [Pyrinomonadaceae bacterium]|nr:hypothetical protein [Pyrinomonadaceae bacterium]
MCAITVVQPSILKDSLSGTHRLLAEVFFTNVGARLINGSVTWQKNYAYM